MSLIKKAHTRSWQLTSAEVGGMTTGGMTPEKIASVSGLSLPYVADLISLYYGWKKYPHLLDMPRFTLAKSYLKELRDKELKKRLESFK